MEKLQIKTGARIEFVEITEKVQGAVSKSGVRDGFACVWIPHTTAGVTINENADPDVCRDLTTLMTDLSERGLPLRHAEGNSPAHLLSSLTGCSVLILVEEGRLCLGTWQGIYLSEFDGPRTRQCWVKMLASGGV